MDSHSQRMSRLPVDVFREFDGRAIRWWTCLTVFLFFFTITTDSMARKGDISPVPGPGLKIVPFKGQKAALAEFGDLTVRIRLSTNPSFFFLDVQIENRSTSPVKIDPGLLVLRAKGEEVDALDPELYIEQAYEFKPYPIDEKGRIVPDDDKKLAGPVRLGDPTNSKVNSLAEMMTEEEWKDGSSNDRMKVTKELLSLKRDLLTVGGRVLPGKTAHARKIYQRTSVELPIVATFTHPLGRMSVKFERER